MSVMTEKIAFIGAGHMADGLVKAFLSSGIVKPDQITVTASPNDHWPRFQELGCNVSNDNCDVLPGGRFSSDIVLLCVHRSVLIEKSPFVQWTDAARHVIVLSMVSGITMSDLQRGVRGPNLSLYSVMRCATGCQALRVLSDGHSKDSTVSSVICDGKVRQLLSPLAAVQVIQKLPSHVYHGLSETSISMGYTIIQAMADGAIEFGVPKERALQIIAMTMMEACKMVIETGSNAIQLRDERVNTLPADWPPVSTMYGIVQLEESDVPAAIADAMRANLKRNHDIECEKLDKSEN